MITKQDDIQPAEETVTDLCGNAEQTVYAAKHSPPNHAHFIKDNMGDTLKAQLQFFRLSPCGLNFAVSGFLCGMGNCE
eukprot:6075173-Pleurochrysis_carterae.AAC.1